MAKTTSIALALALEEEAKRQREDQEAQIRRDESLAERFAEPDLRREQIELLQTERRLGAPEIKEGRIPSEDRLRFTDPEGFRHEFWPGGTLRSTTYPTTLSNQYTPRDQKKIQDLYQQRSDIATSPELDGDEDARQNALDEIDASINRIPHIPPTLKEPTAQQQFDANIVRGPDGKFYNWDGKKATPIESKGELNKQTEWKKHFQKSYDAGIKTAEEFGDTASEQRLAEIIENARRDADLLTNIAMDEIPDDTFIGGMRRGEGTVSSLDEQGNVISTTEIRRPGPRQQQVPAGLEPIWQNLNDEDRAEAIQAMQLGHSAKTILDEYKKSVGSR